MRFVCNRFKIYAVFNATKWQSKVGDGIALNTSNSMKTL